MPTLDFSAWLSLISTVAIIVALAFIQSAQGDSWTRAMNAVGQLPADASAEEVDASGEWAVSALLDFGVRLESIGYMQGHEPAHLKYRSLR